VGQLLESRRNHRVNGDPFDRRGRRRLFAGFFDEFIRLFEIHLDAAGADEPIDQFVAVNAIALVAVTGGDSPSPTASNK
jgi:hypothetical protein